MRLPVKRKTWTYLPEPSSAPSHIPTLNVHANHMMSRTAIQEAVTLTFVGARRSSGKPMTTNMRVPYIFPDV